MCTYCGFSLYVSCRNCNTNAGSIVDRPLLNTKWMLPNSTIVLSMWFIISSNSFTVWDISFILQKLLHSSMIPGVSSLNLHEYAMADVSTVIACGLTHLLPAKYRQPLAYIVLTIPPPQVSRSSLCTAQLCYCYIPLVNLRIKQQLAMK